MKLKTFKRKLISFLTEQNTFFALRQLFLTVSPTSETHQFYLEKHTAFSSFCKIYNPNFGFLFKEMITAKSKVSQELPIYYTFYMRVVLDHEFCQNIQLFSC